MEFKGYNTSVPSNGTITVDLNVIDQAYYGQFNFDDGSSVLYLSCFFNVAHNTSQTPVVWGQSAAAAWSSSLAAAKTTTTAPPTSTTSTTTSTSSATIVSTTTTSAAVQTATKSPTASQSSGLSSGAIAGIAVGVVIGVLALLGMGIFFWWRNKKANKPFGEVSGYQPPPHQQSFIGNVNNNNQAEKALSTSYSDHPNQNPQATQYAELASTEKATSTELAGHNSLQELP